MCAHQTPDRLAMGSHSPPCQAGLAQGLWKSPENFSPLPSLAFGFVLPLPSLVYLQADDEATVGLMGRRLVTGIIHQHMLGVYSGSFPASVLQLFILY